MNTSTRHTSQLPSTADALAPPLSRPSRSARIHMRKIPASSGVRERLVLVSDRVVHGEDARRAGLPMLLRRVLHAEGGLWFGCSGTISGQPSLHVGRDAHGDFAFAGADLREHEYAAVYHGFPACVLHPLLEWRLQDMRFERQAMLAWFGVIARLAGLLCRRLLPGDRIWVHGCHWLPLARALRKLGVGNPISLSVHGSLPSANVLAAMPCHDEVFGALRDFDLVTVPGARDARALREYLQRLPAADGPARGRTPRVLALPVGIDVAHLSALARRAASRRTFARFRRAQGSRRLLIGVDEPDHTDGLCLRLHALEHLLATTPALAGSFSMLQVALPSDYDSRCCRDHERELNRVVGEVNGRHATPGWSPVCYVKKALREQALAGYFRAAQVAVMTPLHDGVTLAAKAYVACQDPSDPGVLVLSRQAAAEQELTDAVLVNPRDVADVAAGIQTALNMPRAERQARWVSQMQHLQQHDVRVWTRDALAALARAASHRSTGHRSTGVAEPGRSERTI